jgi:hypothetical protein
VTQEIVKANGLQLFIIFPAHAAEQDLKGKVDFIH